MKKKIEGKNTEYITIKVIEDNDKIAVKTNTNITQKHLLYAFKAMIENMLDTGIDKFMITAVTAKALAENHKEE